MKKTNKAGFTLIELMVVAIIVAILAAVAIPLMSGNKRRAMATEAQAGCGHIRTALRVMQADSGLPAAGTYSFSTLPNGVKGINDGDLNGTYFIQGDYSLTVGSSNSYVITVSGSKPPLTSADTLVMSNSANNVAGFGGSLVE